MKRSVALLDSGIDPTHRAFATESRESQPPPPGVLRAIAELNTARRRIVHGNPCEPIRLAESLTQAIPNGYWSARQCEGLWPARCFAGYGPPTVSSGSNRVPARLDNSTMDLTGHGTAAAGILVRRGFHVLPLKVSFTAVNAVSMEGLVDACIWLSTLPKPVRPTIALWPFGTPDQDSREVFTELADILTQVGIAVYASGRGVFQNICEEGFAQFPADLSNVVAIDEFLRVTEYVVRVSRTETRRYRYLRGTKPLPMNTPIPPDSIITVDCIEGAEHVLRGMTGTTGRYARDTIMIVSSSDRYAYPREPVPDGWTVLLGDAPPPRSTSFNLVYLENQIEIASAKSKPPAVSAGTGIRAPVACTISGYSPVYGSSFALPAGIPREVTTDSRRAL